MPLPKLCPLFPQIHPRRPLRYCTTLLVRPLNRPLLFPPQGLQKNNNNNKKEEEKDLKRVRYSTKD